MPTRTLTRFVPPGRGLRARPGLERWGGYALLGVSSLLLAGLAWVGPRAWGDARRQELMEAFLGSVTTEPVQVSAAMETPPEPGPGFPDDPAAVRAVLEAHPLVQAVVSADGREARIREGMGLRRATEAERARLAAWNRTLRAQQDPRYDPPGTDEAGPAFLLRGGDWSWFEEWRPGSPDVEAFLRRTLGPFPRVRAGLARLGEMEGRGGGKPLAPAFRPPNLQASIDAPEAVWIVEWTGTVYGPRWEAVFMPWPEEAARWEAQVRRRTWEGRALGLGTLLLLVLGLASRRRMRRRQALEADRLASLTHSLKTPLAIHKLRCDSLRMGRLAPDRAAEELMRLGQEVDELTRIIERGLLAGQARSGPGGPGAPLEAVLGTFGPGWLEDVAEGLRPAVEDAGRELALDLADREGRAHLPSLQSALQTLLENAYYHGRGAVRLRSRAERDRLVVEVSDEGPGVDAQALAALAQPFQRIRAEGEEGFRHEGQGLGLCLLVQVARQEGWGLRFRSEPGQGFAASLELPVV